MFSKTKTRFAVDIAIEVVAGVVAEYAIEVAVDLALEVLGVFKMSNPLYLRH